MIPLSRAIINRPVLSLRRAELFYSYLATPSGLSDQKACQRLHSFGKNQIEFDRCPSPLLMLLPECTALFALLLVVLLNALGSFSQNYRVEQLMLSLLITPQRSCIAARW